MVEIRVRNKRSHKDTQRRILDMAKYGDHSIERRERVRLETDEDVKRFFAECEVDFYEFVEDCRNKDEKVPEFEDLLSNAWQVDSGGGSVSYVDEAGDKTVLASGGESGFSRYLATWAFSSRPSRILTGV